MADTNIGISIRVIQQFTDEPAWTVVDRALMLVMADKRNVTREQKWADALAFLQ